MKRVGRAWGLGAVAVCVAGCSSMQSVEVQNRGPGPVTVTFRFQRERDSSPFEEIVEVAERGSKVEGIWFGEAPETLKVEARWSSTSRTAIFRRDQLPPGLARTTSAGTIHGLEVSPDGFRWGPPSLWIQVQNPALIPLWLGAVGFGIWAMAKWDRRTYGTRSELGTRENGRDV